MSSLVTRFQATFQLCKMDVGHSMTCIDNLPFSDKIYLVAPVLDPQFTFMWVDADIAASEQEKENLKTEIRGLYL